MTSLSRCFLSLFIFGFVSTPFAAAQSNSDAQAKDGAILFRDKGCAYCHGMDLGGTKKAPRLADVRNDKAWTPEKITDQILNGGQKMPPFNESVSDDEVAQLIAFLRAKNRPPIPPAEDGSTPPAPPK